jgi:hypothetical protein
MIELFDHYYPYTSIGDSKCNAIALENMFEESAIALPFQFTIYLGLGMS